MGIKRTKYTPEFKAEAVQFVDNSGRSITQIARELGIPHVTLGTWVKKKKQKERSDAGPVALNVSERARLKELENDNRRLNKENEFLKKAAAWFAAQNQ